MQNVLLQMASLILCGIGWKLAKPAGLDPVATRRVLTSLVYYLLLPALVLSILWKAELGANSLIIAASAAFGIISGMIISLLVCRVFKLPSTQAGALILAATFPNATYLGLPVLEATFGPWARSVAIQYDLFACTPLLFTIGIWLAARMGQQSEGRPSSYLDLLRIPAIWAVFLALILNGLGVKIPTLIDDILGLLNRGVVPLMLISLGLSLDWNASRWKQLPNLIPTILITLIIVPALIFSFTRMMGLSGDLRSAVVLEGAMPSMVLGIVLCDRFNLDVGLYASAVTVTTVLSMISLPIWYSLLS
jgi:malate permease and related proteins